MLPYWLSARMFECLTERIMLDSCRGLAKPTHCWPTHCWMRPRAHDLSSLQYGLLVNALVYP